MALRLLINQFDMEFSVSNPVVGLEKLWFLQKRHAKQRIVEGGQPYQEILSWTVEAAREVISEDQLHEMGLADDENLCTRVDRVLRSTGDWTTATEFIEAYRCFFSNTFAETDKPADADLRKTIPDDDARIWFQAAAAKTFKNALEREDNDISAESARELFESCCTQIENDWALQSHLGIASTKDISRAAHIIMRIWLAGGANMPSTFESLSILGPALALSRIRLNSGSQ
jgi:hypothetical protein